MSNLFRFAWAVCVLLLAAGAAGAKEFIVRCDVVELEYADGDEHGLGEPVKSTVRYAEIKVGETSEFSHTEARDGWSLSIRGKATGVKDGKLGVDALQVEYQPPEGQSGRQQLFGSSYWFMPGRIDRAGGGGLRAGNGPLHERLFFYSAHEAPPNDRADEERCAEIRKAVLAQVAEMRKQRKVEFDYKEKAAGRVLAAAKELLENANDEGAGRVLLETVIRQFGETEACREAKQIWIRLPNVTYRPWLESPKHVAQGVRNGAPEAVERKAK